MKPSLCQPSPIFLKNGALFIADVHYHKGVREEFEEFIETLTAPQIFLMGDIFDLLVGKVSYTLQENASMIEKLQHLSQRCDCYYLEGNHDFFLQDLFPKIRVISRFEQPLIVQTQSKRVALAHGDIFIEGLYRSYIELLHKKGVVEFLNLCDIGGWISKKIQRYNAQKRLCKKIENFVHIAHKRLQNYSCDIVIEGHFHQEAVYKCGDKEYINLPSFGCTQKVLCFKNEKFSFAQMRFQNETLACNLEQNRSHSAKALQERCEKRAIFDR